MKILCSICFTVFKQQMSKDEVFMLSELEMRTFIFLVRDGLFKVLTGGVI